MFYVTCSRVWNRTKIQDSKGLCPALRRPGNVMKLAKFSENRNPKVCYIKPFKYFFRTSGGNFSMA